MKRPLTMGCLATSAIALVAGGCAVGALLYVFFFWVDSYPYKEGEKSVLTKTYPSGDVLKLEVYPVTTGLTSYEQRQLFVGEERLGMVPVRSLDQIQIFHFSDHDVLVADTNVYVRNSGDTYWMPGDFMSEGGSDFLRTFAKPGVFGADYGLSRDNKFGNLVAEPPPDAATYHFDHLDESGTTLIASSRETSIPYPQKLVLKLKQPGDKWILDLDVTRKMNGLSAPVDPGLVAEVTLIRFPKQETVLSPDDVAKVSGASKVFSATQPLHAADWVAINTSYQPSSGPATGDKVEIRYGFTDPDPHYVALFVRSKFSDLPYMFTEIGEWSMLEGEGYEDGYTYETFFES